MAEKNVYPLTENSVFSSGPLRQTSGSSAVNDSFGVIDDGWMTDNLHGLDGVKMIEPLDGLDGGNMNIDDGTSNTDSDDEGSKVSNDTGTGEPKVFPKGEYNTISTVIYR